MQYEAGGILCRELTQRRPQQLPRGKSLLEARLRGLAGPLAAMSTFGNVPSHSVAQSLGPQQRQRRVGSDAIEPGREGVRNVAGLLRRAPMGQRLECGEEGLLRRVACRLQ